VEGNIVAEELTIGGRVKGTIHANRVKLSSTAVVEGDIYHRSLAMEENAQFEGMSRRQENVIDTPSRILPTPPQQAVSIDGNRKGDGAPGERMRHADLGGAAVTTAVACVAAVIISLIGGVVLNSIQESTDQAFSSSAVRLSK
jgi:hypothetical protein